MRCDKYRSMLFVPATRPERIFKAMESDADVVIVDLEDSVQLDQKDIARASLEDFLKQSPESHLMVRINSSRREFGADLAVCANSESVIGVILPKAESPQQIEKAAACGKPVWPLIETAKGLMSLQSLVFTGGIDRLIFGAVDMATDLNLHPNSQGAETILDQCRYQLVVCSRAAGLAPPIESVVTEIKDLDKVEQAASKAVGMGFCGMLSIHPKQVPAINRVFTPDDEIIKWARHVLQAAHSHGGAFQLDGQMVDAPVIIRARAILARAGV